MRAPARRSLTVLALVVGAIALLVIAPVASLASSSGSTQTFTPAQSSGGFTASAAWNGVNVQTAGTASSAFHISFNGAVNIVYTWSSTEAVAAGYSINDARLQIYYFGFALATRDISSTTGASSGSLLMGNWSTGPLQYVLEGTYLLTASLLDTNGTTAWSQSFWVETSAAFYIFAALPIVLILIAVYEVYGLATSGRHAKVSSPPKGESNPPPETTAAPNASAAPPDPAGGTTPPPGGTS